jgi:glycosyltransferase involved in cell wall biosynthesis
MRARSVCGHQRLQESHHKQHGTDQERRQRDIAAPAAGEVDPGRDTFAGRRHVVDAVGAHLVRQIVAQVGLPADRVHSTCMGVDLGVLSKLGGARAIVPGALHLVTVARLNAMKGHVRALVAVRQAVVAGADIRYTIAGDGKHRAVIAARIAELGLDDRVKMVVTLSEANVFALPRYGWCWKRTARRAASCAAS